AVRSLFALWVRFGRVFWWFGRVQGSDDFIGDVVDVFGKQNIAGRRLGLVRVENQVESFLLANVFGDRKHLFQEALFGMERIVLQFGLFLDSEIIVADLEIAKIDPLLLETLFLFF